MLRILQKRLLMLDSGFLSKAKLAEAVQKCWYSWSRPCKRQLLGAAGFISKCRIERQNDEGGCGG